MAPTPPPAAGFHLPYRVPAHSGFQSPSATRPHLASPELSTSGATVDPNNAHQVRADRVYAEADPQRRLTERLMKRRPCQEISPTRGTLLGRPSEGQDGRPPLREEAPEASRLCPEREVPWKRRALQFAVRLLFLPAEALKEVLERRPGAGFRKPQP